MLTVAKIINKIALHWSKSGVPAASLDVEEEENGEGGDFISPGGGIERCRSRNYR